MRMLITGATGFLGSHLCRRMVQEGHNVRILCRPTSNLTILEGLPVERCTGDVTDLASVQRAVQGQEWVVHAAANLSYWGRDQVAQLQVNVEGTRHVARACRLAGVARLVHISSVAAIGIPTDSQRPANEDFPCNLEGTGLLYHLSKRRAEEAVLAEVAQGLDAVLVNPASIFGPYDSQYRGSEMLRKVRQTRVVPYFIGGLCVVHVEDVIQGIRAAFEKGVTGQRYILGGENLTFRAIVERTACAMHVRRWFVPVLPPVTGLAALLLEPWGHLRKRRPRITWAISYCANRCHFYDSSKARTMLGYTPRDFQAILHECLRLGVC